MNLPAYSSSTTLPEMCNAALRTYSKPDAVSYKRDGVWHSVSSEVFSRRTRSIALGLTDKLQVRKGERIALLAENRPEWSIIDLAVLSCGAVNVPIYTTQAAEQVRFILEDSRARVLFISNRKLYRHIREAIDAVESLEHVVFIDNEETTDARRAIMLPLAELEEHGARRDEAEPKLYEQLLERVSSIDTATIIYTSGTTGDPKGVELTHRNFTSNIGAIARSLPIYPSDVALSVLPLSHIFERTVCYVFCCCGVSIHYAASSDQLGEYLREVRPTIMTAVPRIFEKVYHRIIKQGIAAGGWKRRVFEWSLDVGQRYAKRQDKAAPIPARLKVEQALADRLVFKKWRAGVGGRLRYFVSGGAPLSPTLSYAYLAAGIMILQGYGMTETCVVSANRPEDNQVSSVGLPFPGIELKIADDGEVLVRGENVMPGYYRADQETREVFTPDGWFKTGDVGRIDERGHLHITDRKKDLFKLSNGKYVAPQIIESLIKQSALVSQVIVVGGGRKQPAALVVPEWETLKTLMNEAQVRVPETRQAWSRDPTAVKIVQREVASLTAPLADYERVRRVALLSNELTIDSGELTPSFKVKRHVVDQRYKQLIDELYDKAG